MVHDRDYFLRRADEARAAAFCREQDEDAEIAGQLALAYSALARRHCGPAPQEAEPAEQDSVA